MGRWLAAVGVLVAVAAVVLVLANGGGDSGRIPAAAEREAQSTPTPTAIPQASIESAGISEHLRALRDAAGDEGTRAAASPGDAATARYMAGRLRAAGYRVSEQAFRVPLFLERTPPRVTGLRRSQVITLAFSGSGRAAGRVRRVGSAAHARRTRTCAAGRSRWPGAGCARSPAGRGWRSAWARARCS